MVERDHSSKVQGGMWWKYAATCAMALAVFGLAFWLVMRCIG